MTPPQGQFSSRVVASRVNAIMGRLVVGMFAMFYRSGSTYIKASPIQCDNKGGAGGNPETPSPDLKIIGKKDGQVLKRN